MTKVQVTKNEYDYLETFESKNKALFYISRYGWFFDLKDGQEQTHNDKRKKWSKILGIDVSDKVRYKLIRAVLDGYELKEQLYTVQIPDPYGQHIYKFLRKDKHSNVFIECTGYFDWKSWDKCQLTEEEIKKDFDWAWPFAKPVEEE